MEKFENSIKKGLCLLETLENADSSEMLRQILLLTANKKITVKLGSDSEIHHQSLGSIHTRWYIYQAI